MDSTTEGTETIHLEISPNAAYSVGGRSSADMTITDLPMVAVEATDAMASELGPDSGAFTFTRTGSTSSPLQIFYTIGGDAGNGGDYQPIGWSVTIPANQRSVTITITPIQENLRESAEAVRVTIDQNLARR